MATHQLTALITKEGNSYVALCAEFDIASQGATVESARSNLLEALTLFYQTADASEISSRLTSEFYITGLEVTDP